MAIKVPPIGTVTTLWQTRSQAAVAEYKAGVQTAGQEWQAGVDNAADNWATGVAQAAGNGSYSKGVSNKASMYVDKAVNVGSTRYSSGVAAGGNAYNQGMGKVLAVIAGVTLPPRNVAGSNGARSDAVSAALHQAKISGQV